MRSRVPSPSGTPLPPDPPVPPPPQEPDFLIHFWDAGLEMVRCGPRGLPIYKPYLSPNPYRFSSLKTRSGGGVATLYAGSNVRAAIAETVFHDIPPRGGPRSVPFDRIKDRVIGRVVPRRNLKLADFTSAGLHRVGATPREITETGPVTYPKTASWGQAVYDHEERFDGIYWMSRLANVGPAVMLFGRRVRAADLIHTGARDLEPLTAPSALETLLGYAEDLDLQISGLPWLRH